MLLKVNVDVQMLAAAVFSEAERQLHCELMGGSKYLLLDRELINEM